MGNNMEAKESSELTLSDLNFKFDLKECDFQLDALQNQMLQHYIRTDMRFRRAFNTDWTPYFIQYFKDKAKLKEPSHISTIGVTRSGKSFGMISLAVILSLLNGKQFSIKYICPNSYEFIERLKTMDENELLNSVFLIDEEKKAVYSAGSTARKMKITDVQNIIAINNISTISITPDRWSNEQANYGLRSFGRCFKTGIIRFMLYNLQEGGKGGTLPLGMIYIPMFTKMLPERFSKPLEKDYMESKHLWVNEEMRGKYDVVAVIHKKTAQTLMRDEQFTQLKKMKEKKAYIQTKLGSEWSQQEIINVLSLTEMLRRGVKFDD